MFLQTNCTKVFSDGSIFRMKFTVWQISSSSRTTNDNKTLTKIGWLCFFRRSPLADGPINLNFRGHLKEIYHWKALITENLKISLPGSFSLVPKQRSSSSQSGWREYLQVCYDLICSVSRLTLQKKCQFWLFSNIIWPFTSYGHMGTLWH